MKLKVLAFILVLLVAQQSLSDEYTVTKDGQSIGKYSSDLEVWNEWSYEGLYADIYQQAIPLVIDSVTALMGDFVSYADERETTPATTVIEPNLCDLGSTGYVNYSGAITVLLNNGIGDGHAHIEIIIYVQHEDETVIVSSRWTNKNDTLDSPAGAESDQVLPNTTGSDL